MKNELVVYKTLKTLGQVIDIATQTVKLGRFVRKRDIVLLREQMNQVVAQSRATGLAKLVRLSINEMQMTANMIEQMNLCGEMQAMALNLLNQQYQALCINIQGYMRNEWWA